MWGHDNHPASACSTEGCDKPACDTRTGLRLQVGPNRYMQVWFPLCQEHAADYETALGGVNDWRLMPGAHLLMV